MKKIICLTLTALFVLLAGACAVNTNSDATTTRTYTRMAQVVEIDTINDTVVCADSTGEAWEFYGVEDWQEGDFIVLTMDNNGTKNIYDDEIIKTIYKSDEKKINFFSETYWQTEKDVL